MSLNIKNERVHELAREAARVTGKTQTGAIEEALMRLLEQYGADPAELAHQRKLAKLNDIIERARKLPPPTDTYPMTIEDLYDPETGLPR